MRQGTVNQILGKTIESYTMQADGERFELQFADGTRAVFEPEGDCCSYSWIESIDTEAALCGKLLGIEEIEMPDLGNIGGKRRSGVDQVSYYGLKITTEKGRAVLDYRNDSNGYYGGWLNLRVEEA